MSALILSFLLAMQIEVTGNCPGAAEVEEKLIPLLPPGFASASTDRATITEDADGLSVALARPDGRATIARRRFPRARTCAEQAEMVPCADVFRVARENSAIERFGLCKVTRPMLLDSDRKLVACVLSRCSRRLFYRHVQYHVIGTNLTE